MARQSLASYSLATFGFSVTLTSFGRVQLRVRTRSRPKLPFDLLTVGPIRERLSNGLGLDLQKAL